MSLMGTTKHHFSSHGAEPRRSGHDAHDLPRSDANSPDLAAPKRFRSPRSSASSPAPNKRTKTHQASGTPTTFVTTNMGASTTAKAHRRSTTRIGRIPLADLRSTQSQGLWPTKDPKWQEMHAPKTDGAGEVPTRNDQIPQRCDSDEEFLGGGDIFTSTDQQQLSVRRSKMDDYDETTTEF